MKKLKFSTTIVPLFVLCLFALSGKAQTVQVTSATFPNAVNSSCTNTLLDASLTILCINASHTGNVFAISGSTITVDIDYSLGPICLGALAFPTQNINLGLIAAGTYTVNINGLLNGSSVSTLTQTLTVVSCCSASPSFTLSTADTICVGDSIAYTSTGNGLTSQKWYENNILQTTGGTYGKSYNTPGVFNVTLIVGDASCVDSLTKTIVVNAMPIADLGADTAICMGSTLTLYSDVLNDSVLWSDGSFSDSLVIDSAGIYFYTVYNGTCWSADTVIVSLNTPPSVSLGNDTTLCTGDSIVLDATLVGASYLWQDNSTSPTFTANATGTYSVSITDANGCSSNSSMTVTIDPNCFVSMDEKLKSETFTFYPNPANDFLIIEKLSNGASPLNIKIMDATGKIVLKFDAQKSDGQLLKINISSLPKGTYFLNVEDISGIANQAFIKN